MRMGTSTHQYDSQLKVLHHSDGRVIQVGLGSYEFGKMSEELAYIEGVLKDKKVLGERDRIYLNS